MIDQFLSKLLDKYGLARIVIALLIAFVVLWALAHFAATPGGNVSVLWGLVQYTKSNHDTPTIARSTVGTESTKKQQTLSQHQEMSEPSADIPDDLGVIHGITPKTSEQTLKSLRAKRQLRGLETLESGRSVADTARGTYFFVFYAGMSTSQGKMVEKLMDRNTKRFRENDSYFEIHLLKRGTPVIVGLTSESDAIRVGSPTPEIHKISIAPVPWDKMTSLLSLSADRIVSAKDRTVNLSERESIYILDCEIR